MFCSYKGGFKTKTLGHQILLNVKFKRQATDTNDEELEAMIEEENEEYFGNH